MADRPALVARANFAVALVEGLLVGLPSPLDAGSTAAEQGLGGAFDRPGSREAASALLPGRLTRRIAR